MRLTLGKYFIFILLNKYQSWNRSKIPEMLGWAYAAKHVPGEIMLNKS